MDAEECGLENRTGRASIWHLTITHLEQRAIRNETLIALGYGDDDDDDGDDYDDDENGYHDDDDENNYHDDDDNDFHGGFTIFAPTDAAFTLLPRSAVAQLQNNTEKLREVVLFHVIPGAVKLDDLRNNIMLNSASPKGRKLRVNVYQHGNDDETVITVNGARIRRHDMIATNGVIHVIDRVLYPMADLSIIDHLTTCETFTGANVAVTGAGLTPVLDREGPYTVFLPTTEAFAAIDNATVSSFIQNITMLQNVLMYHILPGAYFSEGLRDGMWLPTMAEQELQVRLTSDGYTRRLAGVGIAAKVLKHDIIAKNGVIHVIDTVLRPEKEEPICGHF
ncbi:transforming growth factor-beta-induced protein ig-h3-like [Palaemon carinicauda]|uniref:transforming growth factor-beta-induced protein ig-h3-like n=1 Tax=Palaemon carinicauda TaxID=392227 RepID=UPI0035B5735D